MTRLKGTPNVHAIVAPVFHPFTPTREPGEATRIEQPCSWCGEKLLSSPWYSTVMITCENAKCPQFRQPVRGR